VRRPPGSAQGARSFATMAAAQAEQLVGMARYTKGAILGEGTFGVVYKAVDKQASLLVFHCTCCGAGN